jgi:hypothetical protein
VLCFWLLPAAESWAARFLLGSPLLGGASPLLCVAGETALPVWLMKGAAVPLLVGGSAELAFAPELLMA